MATRERLLIRRIDTLRQRGTLRPIEHANKVTFEAAVIIEVNGRPFECRKWKHGGTCLDLLTLDEVLLEVE